MDIDLLERKFARITARVKVSEFAMTRWRGSFSINIRKDAQGEFFDIQVPQGEGLQVEAIDIRPNVRHLLLMVRQDRRKDKFLCGHDERHWFVAAVPGGSASTVRTAMEALKPEAVRQAQSANRVTGKEGLRRKNVAFTRQGEWFFVPAPGLTVEESLILRNEPISRGRGKSHICQYVYRRGGATVYVCQEYPTGLEEAQYKALLKEYPKGVKLKWRVMQRDAEVYVRGHVRHPDHKTISLSGWHRVYMNTEFQAASMSHVAFLD